MKTQMIPFTRIDGRTGKVIERGVTMYTPKKPNKKAFTNVRVCKDGFVYESKTKTSTSASFPLFLIRQAWDKGCSFEDECDGFGEGGGTNGDWSGIRDSSSPSVNKMLEKALNFLFE